MEPETKKLKTDQPEMTSEAPYTPKNIFLTGGAGKFDAATPLYEVISCYEKLTKIHLVIERIHRVSCCHPSMQEVPTVQHRCIRQA